MEYAVCAASSDSEDATTELEELPSTKKLRRCKQRQIEKMEYAVCAASSDSEGATDSEDATTELEEERVASNTDQQGPLFEVAAESTSDAQGSSGFAFINKAAPPRESWDSLNVLKVEAGEKPNHKDIQNLIHFAKNDGNKVPVPGGVLSTLAVNVTKQTIHENDEQELAKKEDVGKTTEVKFHSSTSGQIDWAALAQAWIAQREATATEVVWQQTLVHNGQDIPPVGADISNHGNFQSDPNFNRMWQPGTGIRQQQIPRLSEVQWKRNLTGGQNQASKLVKRSEQPQTVQMPLARTGCGESAPFQTPCQWSESFQTRYLERNYAAKEPINYAQSTELSSLSSQLVEHQEVHIEAVTKYKCSNCSMSFSNQAGLRTHIGVWHKVEQRFTCSKCNTIFNSMLLLNWHSATAHNVFGRVTCLKCGKVCPNQPAFENHQCAINVIKPLSFSFPCTERSLQFSSFSTIPPSYLDPSVNL